MVSEKRFVLFVRGSAFYDLIVTAPFVTPWTLTGLFAILNWVHGELGLAGEALQLSVGTTLFANLLGSVVVIWSLARIMLPLPMLGRLDAASRCLFACWQIFAMANGASLIIAAFTAMELFWGVLQLLPYQRRPNAGKLNAATI